MGEGFYESCGEEVFGRGRRKGRAGEEMVYKRWEKEYLGEEKII